MLDKRRLTIAHLGIGDVFNSKWANAQAAAGADVHMILIGKPMEQFRGVTLHPLPFSAPWGYLLNAPFVRALLHRLKPDLLHVHYATGFGTLGRLAAFHPCVLSTWGSDVMVAPQNSRVMRALVQANLRHYDRVCATSRAMIRSILELGCPSDNLHQTPFGVDTERFRPQSCGDRCGRITIGTVKSMLPVYGIDALIDAFALARRMVAEEAPELLEILHLLIVGDGPELASYRLRAANLGLAKVATFTGAVPNSDVPRLLNSMDVFVALSRSESFGVAVLEASACGIPVIVTDIGGLPEVVDRDVTGLIVPPSDVDAAASAIVRLVRSRQLRQQLGAAGRARVVDVYGWQRCLRAMDSVYEKVLAA